MRKVYMGFSRDEFIRNTLNKNNSGREIGDVFAEYCNDINKSEGWEFVAETSLGFLFSRDVRIKK